MWVTKLFIAPVKKKDFLPKNYQIWPQIGIFGQFGPGHAGLFSALLEVRLVVVARGLYLARHLFTLFRLEQRVEVCFLFDLIEPRSSLQTARLSRMCLNTPEAEQGPWIQVIGSLKLEHCTSVPIACSIMDSMTGAKNMNSRP